MAWYNPFSWFKGKKEQKGAAPQFYKTYSFSDYPVGKAAKRSVEEKLAGRNLGIPERVFEKARSPIAAPYRRELSDYTIPAISAAASARGLGRSTIPVSQIRQATQETGETIADKLARLRIENEELKRRELARAEEMGYQMGSAEAGAATATNRANLAEFERQRAIREGRVDEANRDLAKLQGLGLTAVGLMTGQPLLVAMGASALSGDMPGGKFSPGYRDLIEEIWNIRKREPAVAKKKAGESGAKKKAGKSGGTYIKEMYT
jgi:hypothetical protein